MSLSEQTILRVVLYEGAGSRPLPGEDRYATVSSLLEKGFAVTRANGQGGPVAGHVGPMLVLGQFSDGQAPSFEDAAGSVRIETRDISGLAREAVVESVEAARNGSGAARLGDWKPWFPVIDYDRCTNCMQCLSFCLFGVYGVDEERRIQAQNHDNCKTNCPACSRVCPEAAIMFPKYKAGPINGDIVRDADLQREKMKVDISALLGGDVYSLLRDRSEKARSRFSKERDADKALKERQKCLTKLVELGDIPPEVLMSLPSPEEIARRADEAAARVKAAQGN
jgi:Pyruvate/2-oxoacid:ferredoxin oxidoreductase delta subunit